MSVTRTSTVGYPASTPAVMASWMPASTAGMYSFGITPPRDRVDELVAPARAERLEGDHDVAVLAAPAGLADVALLDLVDLLADRLAVGDLGLADVRVDGELPQHPVDEDLEVQLAHPRDDGLAGLLVGAHPERRVLLGQAEQGLGQLLLVGLGLRLDGHVDHGLGEHERLELDALVGVAQRVAGRRLLEPDRRDDVPGAHDVEVLAVVRVHLEEPAQPLLAVLGRVRDRAALLERPRVDAEVGELADVGVGHDLEGERAERLVVARPCARGRRPCPARCPGSAAGRAGSAGSSTTASSMGWTPLFLKALPHRIGMQAFASVPTRSARREVRPR